jgi:bacteriocin biosynthesis cyclodehydratase domain-containing protein
VRLLDLLDGTRTESSVLREAGRHGIAANEAAAMLATLQRAGVLADAHTLRPAGLPDATRRRLDLETSALALRGCDQVPAPAATIRRRVTAQVLVTGASRLAVPIACALAAAGVGHLDPHVSGVTRLADTIPGGLLPTDAHRPRKVAAAEAIRRAAPDVTLGPMRPSRASFAVLVGYSAPAALTALTYGSRLVAHLAVTVRDGTVVVGPLVRPGETPCLNCLDQHRHDRDPGWHLVAAQLSTGPDAAEPLATTTALAATAFAAAEVLAHIDGTQPETLGVTVEISESGRWSRRRWSPHPRCDCQRRRRSRPSEPPAPAA